MPSVHSCPTGMSFSATLQVVALGRHARGDLARRGQGLAGGAGLLERTPEGREHLESATAGRADGFRCEQQVGFEGADDDAGLGQCRDDPLVERARSAIAPVPVDGGGAGGPGNRGNHLLGRAAAQDQPPPAGAEARAEAFQRLVQPPMRHAAKRADFRAFLVVDIEQDDRRTAPAGGGEGRIVGKPQIVTKPDKRGSLLDDPNHLAPVVSTRRARNRFVQLSLRGCFERG